MKIYLALVMVVLCSSLVFAQGLIPPITGGNITINQNNTYINQTIFSGGNLSFNQTLTDGLYIFQSEEANLNVNSASWWASLTGWVSGWFFSVGNELQFNETKLNATIDMRATGNTSWNQTLANTLYSPIGTVGNSSFNQTLTDSLYSPIGTGGNSSWNETLADEIYLPMNNNRTETNNSRIYWSSGTLVIEGYN